MHKNDLVDGLIYEENGIRIKEKNGFGGFVVSKNNKMEKRNINQLRMVPSATASVYMLKEYFERYCKNNISIRQLK